LPADLALVLARGEGATVWDSEGRAFTDFTMGWGSVLLGHAHPAIVEAVKSQAGRGSNFAYVTEPALALAEEIIRAVACAERVRFCASGTEATSYAVHLARAYTDALLSCERGISRCNDVGTVSPSLVASDFPRRADVGIGPGRRPTRSSRPNDLRPPSEAHRLSSPAHRRAASCRVPRWILRGCAVASNQPVPSRQTVTGFRLAYGGAQEYYGVRPDLATLGKALGGGYPSGGGGSRGSRQEDRPGDLAMSGSPPASAATRSPPRRAAPRWASCGGPPRTSGSSAWASVSAPGCGAS
jgi:glutamate-1-semialdehyde 2,1-aminomutase